MLRLASGSQPSEGSLKALKPANLRPQPTPAPAPAPAAAGGSGSQAAASGEAAVWEVQLSGQWKPYGPKEQRELEEAWQRGEHEAVFEMRGTTYAVSLLGPAQMAQRAPHGRERPVRRRA